MFPATTQHRFRLDGTPILSKREKLIRRIETGGQRKSHFKSRNGCNACKGKRVKCDETRPSCRKCIARGVACLYPNLASSPRSIHGDALTLAGVNQVASAPLPAEYLLHHFWTHTSGRLIGAQRQRIYRTHMLPLSLSQPSLLHAILAVSARDLLHLQPDRHRLLPVFYHHYQQFATLYNRDLMQPRSVLTANLMHSNAFLMNVLVVADPASTQSTSGVTRTGQEDIDQAFSWIKVQAIHQSILHPYNSYLPQTFWYTEFAKDRHTVQAPQASRFQQEPHLTAHLAELCSIQPADTTDTNVYLSAYNILCTIGETPAVGKHLAPQLFGVYIRFFVEMESPFVQLLHRKDEVALLLLAVWLTQMRRLDLWWMRDRARNECRSICGMLVRSEDWRIRALAGCLAEQFKVVIT
ncbi:Zn(II)2Cys6 transcription factor [Aspergillus brunneoviolaceus CBS 621.78]|uniref:Uncharacterized protein n=1 Tax=Aspergillus brunneoviolaceus CBS 621.78 TaxID=1450534 RepID=A0ACD1FXX3_9EURO|nr:hypothetical protein BO95DRAFT_255754 [Aspergillus brunneoviolaceus CBS 621.78]RAH41829.1 hypothetical protein BO95DRAFT_255754 [Aspergillus brunneoviolaceus CBS 621.78]